MIARLMRAGRVMAFWLAVGLAVCALMTLADCAEARRWDSFDGVGRGPYNNGPAEVARFILQIALFCAALYHGLKVLDPHKEKENNTLASVFWAVLCGFWLFVI